MKSWLSLLLLLAQTATASFSLWGGEEQQNWRKLESLEEFQARSKREMEAYEKGMRDATSSNPFINCEAVDNKVASHRAPLKKRPSQRGHSRDHSDHSHNHSHVHEDDGKRNHDTHPADHHVQSKSARTAERKSRCRDSCVIL